MTPPVSALFDPLTLPNGTTLPNRLAKAAMEENQSEPGQIPGQKLQTLYRRWAQGGAGLLITGNVMVAPDAMTGPGGVVLQEGSDLAPFRAWAKAGTSGGGQLWMQISHPGRQVYANMGEQALSASDIAVDLGQFSKLFGTPRAMTEDEIAATINRFATSAHLAEQAGFTGVEIHAAHGYLISQFLSPLTNKRTDTWGGTLENRARFLMEVVKAVRARVSPQFCVAVKLNSADFQRGGFDVSDAKQVIARLNEQAVDLVELSGGSYESPAMQGSPKDGSTGQREAYFISFARDIATIAEMPIMVTGGITTLETAHEALGKDAAGFGVSVLGVGRAMAFAPDLTRDWAQGKAKAIHVPQVNWKNRALAGLANMAVTKAQLERLAVGKNPNPSVWPVLALGAERLRSARQTRRYKAWRATNRR